MTNQASSLAYPGDMTTDVDEHVALVALLRTLGRGERWASVTERVLEQGSAVTVWEDKTDQMLVPDAALSSAYEQAAADVKAWQDAGHVMVGILDPNYPARLREIHQAPPLLFAVGQLRANDRAIAIVGSRKASDRGLKIASTIADALARQGVTVLSGLAAGIDAAAHTAALAISGRTVAIIGTGITKQYPAANRALQQQIMERGLVLSQFWPDAPPQPQNFLMRNAVMSGYGLATVVVEASEHSGARAQARMAVEHGRPVILTNLVVDVNEWAKALVGRPGVYVAHGHDEALEHIATVLDKENQVSRLLDDLVGTTL